MMKKGNKNTKNYRDFESQAPAGCYYCKLNGNPDYKEVLKLKRFISDRGKLLSKARTGTCSRHQRKLAVEVKKARYLALLPYTDQHAL